MAAKLADVIVQPQRRPLQLDNSRFRPLQARKGAQFARSCARRLPRRDGLSHALLL